MCCLQQDKGLKPISQSRKRGFIVKAIRTFQKGLFGKHDKLWLVFRLENVIYDSGDT